MKPPRDRNARPFRIWKVAFLLALACLVTVPASAQELPWKEHCLSPGETATEVALRFGLSEQDLLWANDCRDGSGLEAGVVLLVPRSGSELLATLLEVRARSRGETTEDLHAAPKKGFTFPDMTMSRQDGDERAAVRREVREQSFIWPLNGKVSSCFGRRGRSFHDGIDIPAPRGTAIVAARSGRVLFAGWQNGYGRTLKIDHGNGVTTLYAHCTAFLVKKGEWVRQGQKIATVGRTGRATGNHLHFSVMVNGKAHDPMGYLP
ncbi:MAG: M23 family metallopeptidase [Synergistaceae bacterium]|jgi:murein DD-endopeptidase MepM/ murein hydrolase activator NlpD|nr:M23 family metallopeptidase [Synergistaceae bacterium]